MGGAARLPCRGQPSARVPVSRSGRAGRLVATRKPGLLTPRALFSLSWPVATPKKSAQQRETLKGELYELCKGTHPKEKALRVEETLERLAELNPTTRPAFAKKKLEGTWQLIWASQSASRWASPARVAGGFVLQVVRPTTGRVDNIVRWPQPNITIRGGAAVKASTESYHRRTDLTIDSFGLEIGSWAFSGAPWKAPRLTVRGGAKNRERVLNERSGWLDTLFLDDDLRVSVSNVGDYYVHRKLSPEQLDALECGSPVYA